MQSVVTGQAPITLEQRKITSGGKNNQVKQNIVDTTTETNRVPEWESWMELSCARRNEGLEKSRPEGRHRVLRWWKGKDDVCRLSYYAVLSSNDTNAHSSALILTSEIQISRRQWQRKTKWFHQYTTYVYTGTKKKNIRYVRVSHQVRIILCWVPALLN